LGTIIEKFIVCFLISISTASGIYSDTYRPWSLNWGAADTEIGRAMPGDDLLPNPTFNATRAVTIKAKPNDIWPWLIQIGYRRAGFYSYDNLDNNASPAQIVLSRSIRISRSVI
jgi:hypothetical protein